MCSFSIRFCAIFGLSIGVLMSAAGGAGTAAEDSPDLNTRAVRILRQNCGNSGCHGGPSPYSFDVGDIASLLSANVILPGNGEASELILRVESGAMPLGGYGGRAGAKLPAEDIRILKRWIDAGGPRLTARENRRQFVRESEVLAAIIQDLESAPPMDRPYLRYFSLANLWNNPDVERPHIDSSRAALHKLVNHLSWERRIVPLLAIGIEAAIMRIDLRNYGWTRETWENIVAAYPYGVVQRDHEPHMNRIRLLSGAWLPYIRADWFIAAASAPPLYHDILRLPHTLAGLERQLDVDAEFGLRRNIAQRFGLRNSGVSKNNRAVERHSTVYGAYWKSFDFSGNGPEQNVFRDPVNLRADGGEVIFHLPNGLQAYFIADQQGRRIDEAPVNIVRDRTNADDPAVRNGRSCIGCHRSGLNTFQDEIHTALRTRTHAVFDIEFALALYPGQRELERLMDVDNRRFLNAMRQVDDAYSANAAEPIHEAARRYEAPLTVAQAAADLFIENAADLQRRIAADVELQVQGFDQLLGPRGGVKRDSWEQGFGQVARQLDLGQKVCTHRELPSWRRPKIFSNDFPQPAVVCNEGRSWKP